MAKKSTLAAGTSPFAHLLGGAAALAGRALGKKAEDDTPVEEEGPTDEDQVIDDVKDVEEKPSEEERAKKGKKAKGRKAEDDGDQDAEADADDKDDCDDDSETDKEQAAYQRGLAMGRSRESTRCSRIFRSPAAAGRPDIAATLAFTTRNTSAEADRLLTTVGAAVPARRGASLDDRMGARSDARPGAGADRGRPSFAEKMAATKKRVGIA